MIEVPLLTGQCYSLGGGSVASRDRPSPGAALGQTMVSNRLKVVRQQQGHEENNMQTGGRGSESQH